MLIKDTKTSLSSRPLLLHKDYAGQYTALLKERQRIEQPFARESLNNSYVVENKTAIIPVKNLLIADDACIASYFAFTSIEQLAANVRSAVEDPSIMRIVLDINSPGGDSDGIPELADTIAKAKEQKPIYAYTHNVCASAGYWLACACTRIIASKATFLGSIGALIVIESQSEDLAYVISDISPKKVLEPDDLSEAQAIVNYLGKLFIEFVAKNRLFSSHLLTAVRKVANDWGKGSVLDSAQALRVGMVDEIGEFDAVMSTQSSKTFMSKKKTGTRLSKNTSKAGKSYLAYVIVDDEETPLPEGTEAMPLEEVTSEWIKENLPDVAQELIAEGAAGAEEQNTEPSEEQGQEIPAQSPEQSAQALRHIKTIMGIQVFTEKERSLQKKAVSEQWSESRYCMELATLRARHATALMGDLSKDTKGLNTNLPAENETEKPHLQKAKSVFMQRLRAGGLN